jgi:hypothetical protein
MNLRLQADLWLAYLVGSIEALVLARLVLQLFAARPDNLTVSIILGITNPLITPFRMLNTGQPLFGATLEFSTLAVCLLIPILWIIVVRLRRPQPTPNQ